METSQRGQSPDAGRRAAVVGPDEPSPDGQPLTEKELLRLYEENGTRLLAFLAARLPPAFVEDTFQELWIRVLKSAPRYKSISLRSWLFEIARNLAIDVARKKRLLPLEEETTPADHRHQAPDEMLEDREQREILERCLQRLVPKARALVQGRLAGKSYEDLVAALELTSQQAHRVFHSAKDELQKCVQRAMA